MATRRRCLGNQERPYVIYCTTENDRINISLAFAAGANDYLLKPYDTREIRAKLGNAGMV